MYYSTLELDAENQARKDVCSRMYQHLVRAHKCDIQLRGGSVYPAVIHNRARPVQHQSVALTRVGNRSIRVPTASERYLVEASSSVRGTKRN